MRTCIFCGPTDVKIDREHVFPQWISRVFKATGVEEYSANRVSAERDSPTHERKSTMLDITVRATCKTCNSGWLSQLENENVKPIVTPMIGGQPRTLSALEQLTLATWITKLAMVYEFVTPAKQFFTQRDRREFADSLLPPSHSWIWVSVFDHPVRAAQVFQTVSLDKRPKPPRNAVNITTGSVGAFAFQFVTVRWRKRPPTRDAIRRSIAPVVNRWSPVLTEIWPALEDRISWPPAQCLDERAFEALCDRWGPMLPPIRKT